MHVVYPTIFYRTIFPIDLFSLYVLFSLADHVMVPQRTVSFKCRPMHVHPRAYACIINEKTKGKFPGEQNILGNKVYIFWGVGGGGKQDAYSGLGEIVNFPFVQLLSHRIRVSKVFKP